MRRYHQVLIEHHSVSPLVGIGTPPTPLPHESVPSPSDQRVGGHTRLRLRGWGSPNSDDWRKSLALCLLCGRYSHWSLEWVRGSQWRGWRGRLRPPAAGSPGRAPPTPLPHPATREEIWQKCSLYFSNRVPQYTVNNFPFMYSQKAFSQASHLIISTNIFKREFHSGIMIFWREVQ